MTTTSRSSFAEYNHVARTIPLLGESVEAAARRDTVMQIETASPAPRSPGERRDPYKLFHKMDPKVCGAHAGFRLNAISRAWARA
jgi:hypothetical protein